MILSKIDGRKAWKSKQETRNELKIKKNCVEENVATRLKAPVEDRELIDREEDQLKKATAEERGKKRI